MSDISLLLEEAGGVLEEETSPGDLSLTQSNQSDINNAERLTLEDNQSSSHMDCWGRKSEKFFFYVLFVLLAHSSCSNMLSCCLATR